ncbi:MAG: hypothetical protein NUV46_04105 [Nanoarchaeota archaeon]|nr:hypothetical protein [Nanoarchaeota archaeon]
MKKTKEAFEWIVPILRKNKIPFQITGGLAARIYGSNRTLADMDIDLPEKNIIKLEPILKDYIIYGPKMYCDNNFKLLLMTLNFGGQKIDLCGIENQKVFNKNTKKWEKEKINLSQATNKIAYGLKIPVIPLEDLINYKSKIRRRVDLIDIRNISSEVH